MRADSTNIAAAGATRCAASETPCKSEGRERPILFSAPMVRALLDGRKTQTRRAIKGVPSWDHYGRDIMDWGLSGIHQDTYDFNNPIEGTDRWHLDVQTDVDDHSRRVIRCPYGAPGDRLWVREACAIDGARAFYREGHPEAAARGPRVDVRWRPSIHMPRWASRLTLRITDVRAERLNEISEEDADAEGFGGDFPHRVMPDAFPPRDGGWGHLSIPECYARLWEHINGPGSWEANPWVWAVTFEVIKPDAAANEAPGQAGGEG